LINNTHLQDNIRVQDAVIILFVNFSYFQRLQVI